MIRIELLGGLRATRDAAPLDSLLSQRLRSSVFAYIAVEQPVNREALLRLFWPDRETDRARHVLSQMLYELRRDLGSDCVEVHGERLVMPASCQVDVVEFEKRAAAGRCDDALELYRGPFLANVALAENPEFEHWVDARRAHFSRAYRKAVRGVIEQHIARGETERAAVVALQAAGVEPLEDEFHHMAIDLMARAGKRAEALRHFEVYQALLSSAQLTPLDETVALVAAIKDGSATAVPLAALPERPHDQRAREHPAFAAAAAAATFPAPRHRVRWILALAVGVAGLAVPYRWIVTRVPDAADGADRVAVLPFEAIGSSQAPINAETFRAELVNDLTQSRQLAVVSRSDLDAALQPDQALTTTARKSGAVLLIDGVFAVEDTVMRLTVRFWNGDTGRELDSRTYATAHDRLALDRLHRQAQDEIQALTVRNTRFLLDRRQTKNATARQYFEAGFARFWSAQQLMRPPFTGALRGFLTADSALTKAEAADGEFLAPTLMRIQVAQRIALMNELLEKTTEAEQWYRRAIAHGDRAVRLQPRSGEALQARGLAEVAMWSFINGRDRRSDKSLRARAIADFEDAIVADEHLTIANLRLAELYFFDGRAREAKERAQKAYEEDPFGSRDISLFDVLARASLALGQEAESIRWCRIAVERAKHVRSMFCELNVYAYGDSVPPDVGRALSALHTISAPATPVFQPMLVPMAEMLTAAILARAGMADSARSMAVRARAAAPAAIGLNGPEAAVWMRLGDSNRALDILERTVAADPSFVLPTLRYSVFAPLRREPRF
ncbi:MAG TPA: BTAD domain-containing putative transcriptional regulator, partial [Longimicrobiales bacterium]